MAEPAVQLEVEEMTPEEVKAYRAELAAEMEAEESGKPVVDAEPAEKPKEPEPEKEPEKEPDPWEGVPEAIKSQFTTQETRLKQAESRIGALTNELHAANKAATEAETAPTKEQMAEAAKSDEDWEELKEDFPEWASAIEGRLKKMGGMDQEVFDAKIEKIKEDMEGETEAKIEKAILTFAHPEWETTVAEPEYAEWLKTQDEETLEKVKSPRAIDAINILDKYAETRETLKTAAEIASARKERIKKSVTPTGGKADAPKSETDMSEAELRSKIGKEVFSD